MTLLEPPENIVLALDLPRVLGATRPVEGADIGISMVIYDLVIDGGGATVEVDPPLSGTMNPGDVMALWLVGETAVLESKIIVDVNATTTLRIPKGRLHPNRVNELVYSIQRGSQNIGTSAPPLTLLYNKIRPGLKDTKPEIDGHSELELLLPDAIKNGVGPDFVSAQVCVSYPYCRAYDRISLKCNGELMTYQVGKFEAPQPPDPGSPLPITVYFTVTRAYLESAKRPSGKLDFSYTVTDQLGNTPDTDAVWSASQNVDEDLAGTRLPAPILREIQNDPDDDPGLIDLEKLAGNPLLVIVVTADDRFQTGDTINATYTARLEGKPDVVVPVSGIIEADEFGQKKPCILQVPNDKVVAGSTVTVTYEQLRNSTLIGSSKTAAARVIGDNPIDLQPPFLVAPAKNPIEPSLYPDGVRVRVEHLTAHDGDEARLEALNALPGTPEFATVRLNNNKRANFTLSSALLTEHQGKDLRLRWVLISNGVETPSLELSLTVLKMSAIPTFINGPYLIAPAGRLKNVIIRIGTETQPVAEAIVSVALPNGFNYADGGTGVREFITDAFGLITVSGVKGARRPATERLTATYATQTGTADVLIQSYAPPGRIELGLLPYVVAMSHDGTKAYVTSPPSRTICVIETSTNRPINYFNIGKQCAYIAVSPDDAFIYVTHSYSGGTVSFIESLTGRVVKTVTTAQAPSHIALNPSGTELYISHEGTTTISLINTTTTVVRPVVVGERPQGGAFTKDGKFLYICIYYPQSYVSIIDTATQNVIHNIPVAKGPWTCVLSPDNRYLYVAHQDASLISVIDTVTHKVIRTLSVDSYAMHIVINSNGTFLYVSLWATQKILAINTLTFSTHYIPAAGNLRGLAISPDDSRLYVCDSAGSTVTALQSDYLAASDLTLGNMNFPELENIDPHQQWE
ncbi:YncE family protein [Pseudomonas frederiksbergensis]|nr:YncE family protein [Pseudomonas frederiksbergensis]